MKTEEQVFDRQTDRQTDRQYNAIDLAKFICSIFVVAIHVKPLGESDSLVIKLCNYGIQHWMARIAVPFFFVCSGFFLYRKTSFENFNLDGTKKYIIRLLKLYLIWTIIYLPFRIFEIAQDEKGVVHGLLKYVRDLILVGSCDHLWYFPALIFSVALVSYLLSKSWSIKKILVVSLVFYLFGLFGQSWYGIIEPLESVCPVLWSILKLFMKVIGTTRNGLFEGFLFVSIGMYYAFRDNKMSQKMALCFFLISYSLMLLEVAFVSYFHMIRRYDMYIFLVPSTYFAFGYILNARIPGKGTTYKAIRILSSLVFYIHLWIKVLLSNFFDFIGFEADRTFLFFGIVVFVTILFSLMLYLFSKCKRLSWVKRLYLG